MKDTNVNVEETMEEFYLYGNCLAKERISIVRALNQEGKQIDVKVVVKPSIGKAEFFDTNGNKLGLIMSDTDRGYSGFRAKEPAINTVYTAQELIDKVGDTEFDAVVITAVSVGVLKIRVNLDSSKLAQKQPTETKKVETVDAQGFDLSAFTPENAKQVQARINYITSSCKGMSPKVTKNVVNGLIKFLEGHENITDFNAAFINNNGILEKSLVYLLCGNNLGFKGPKGTGKNVCAEQLANILDIKPFNMTMAADVTKDELIGTYAIKGDGTTGMEMSEMLKAVIDGNLLILDEVNALQPGAAMWFHSLTDGRRYLEVPGIGLIHVHPQTRFIFTMNEGDGYAGTREINEAFEDRFQSIVFTSNPESIVDILVSNTGISVDDAKSFFKYYQVFYSAVYNADEMARIDEKYISQRAFIRAGQLWAAGMVDTIHDAVVQTLVEPITDVETKEVVDNLIRLHYH